MTKNKYEHKVWETKSVFNDEETQLNNFGQQGWKLISVVVNDKGLRTFYLRRKIEKKISLRKKKVEVLREKKEIFIEEQLSREIIKHRMMCIIVDKLGCDEAEVTEKAGFVDDLGCDSLDAVELLMEFEKEFSVGLPDERAEKVRTFGEAVDLLYELINKK